MAEQFTHSHCSLSLVFVNVSCEIALHLLLWLVSAVQNLFSSSISTATVGLADSSSCFTDFLWSAASFTNLHGGGSVNVSSTVSVKEVSSQIVAAGAGVGGCCKQPLSSCGSQSLTSSGHVAVAGSGVLSSGCCCSKSGT